MKKTPKKIPDSKKESKKASKKTASKKESEGRQVLNGKTGEVETSFTFQPPRSGRPADGISEAKDNTLEIASKGKPLVSPRRNNAGNTGKRCAHTHPPLIIPTKEGPRKVFGGSCHDPVHDAGIYVHLDGKPKFTKDLWPWSKTTQMWFPIVNGKAPDNLGDFRALIKFLREQLITHNRTVHVGCIGGHGRTGLVLAALYHSCVEGGAPNAITIVRDQYCKKAVESKTQMLWLQKYYEQEYVTPSYGDHQQIEPTDYRKGFTTTDGRYWDF